MFDHPIILIIVVAAALLRWLSQKSEVAKDDPERPMVPGEPIPPSRETNTEEERIRRFLEALGQPTTSKPPPKIAPKRETPRRTIHPKHFNPLPPLVTVPPPLPPPIPEIPVATIELAAPQQHFFQPAIARESIFEVHDLDLESSKDPSREGRPAAAPRHLIPDLSSPRSLRSAIVLREIFGPPRGIQAFEATISPL